jgi:hypothetical protein
MRTNEEIKSWLRWEPVAVFFLIVLYAGLVLTAVWLRQRMTTYDHIFVACSVFGLPLWIYLVRVSINYPLVWNEIEVNPKQTVSKPQLESRPQSKPIESNNKGSFSGRVESVKEKAYSGAMSDEMKIVQTIVQIMDERNISFIDQETAGIIARVASVPGLTKEIIWKVAKSKFEPFAGSGEECYTPFSNSKLRSKGWA